MKLTTITRPQEQWTCYELCRTVLSLWILGDSFWNISHGVMITWLQPLSDCRGRRVRDYIHDWSPSPSTLTVILFFIVAGNNRRLFSEVGMSEGYPNSSNRVSSLRNLLPQHPWSRHVDPSPPLRGLNLVWTTGWSAHGRECTGGPSPRAASVILNSSEMTQACFTTA